MKQKKLRVNQEYGEVQNEIDFLSKSINKKEKDMNKLNDYLAIF